MIFKKAVVRAGLPEWVTTHDLRHFFASHLLPAGESPINVAELLDHNNANTLLKTYAHVIAGQEDRTRRAMDNAWSRPAMTETAQQR
jgi:site-specific recombinase XerD